MSAGIELISLDYNLLHAAVLNISQTEPLTLLQQLAATSRAETAHTLAQSGGWHGLTFHIGGINLVVPVSSDLHIVTNPPRQPLPHCQKWVKGMMYRRGEVYTVIDFAQFIGLHVVASNADARVLLYSNRAHKNALLIGCPIRLTSLEHNLSKANGGEMLANEVDKPTDFPAAVLPWLQASWITDGEMWGVMDMQKIMSAEN